MNKATKQILAHTNYQVDDFNHLRTKGYTNQEVIAIWDRDNERESPVLSLGVFMKAHY